MMTTLGKAVQFLRRGIITSLSYRMAFAISLASIAVGAVRFAYMAGFLQEGNTFPVLADYGGDLMAFLLTGTLFLNLVNVAMSSFKTALRTEQEMGTLEHLLMSDTPLLLVAIMSTLWDFIWALVTSGLMMLVIGIGFDIPFAPNALATTITLGISLFCLSGVGLISAGVVMVTKIGDPVAWAVSTLSGFVGGVLFPVEILPRWLQAIAHGLPLTYALRALRRALISGSSLQAIWGDLLVLIGMSLIFVPLGILVFRWGFNRARREGTLLHY